ncbi:hypothetical protein ILUMI_12391 [Ignelater luminosus]|uniref:Uncharacterized protein n=1 Tax=Ignelater luminosus TaxID=2038154 RepID=A0A8K0CUA8_IGNLU|nr:hypothetical protein ILUMI_12391 [Ignelater luminosus]
MTTRLNTHLLYLILSLLCSLEWEIANGFEWPFLKKTDGPARNWQGKWFPQSPDKAVDDNPLVDYSGGAHHDLSNPKHGINMGIPSPHCDDGKVNITLDWDNSPINYTCYENKRAYLPNLNVHPIIHCDPIPKAYVAPHRCMDTPIFYEDSIPTYGTHRPLWPKYGEYLFLPKQRWIHNLEHGAVVMLYHPCANGLEIQLLKKLVKGCLYRHAITPYTLLPPERPFALVAWGNRLEMSKVVPKLVINFIRNMALKAPEQKSEDGQFDFGLIEHSKVVSDQDDNNLCPNFK